MNKTIYNILIEPSNQDYHELLDYALADCGYALVVVRDSIQLNDKARKTLEAVSKYLYKELRTDEWPGTKLINSVVRVLVYSYTPHSVQILKDASSNLYGWLQPDLPEDLCLLRSDETPWLVTISHEKDGYFVLSENERTLFLNTLPKYRFMLGKEE